MARLKKIRRGKERVVSVEGIHQREVSFVQLHRISEIRKVVVNFFTKLAVGEKTWLARQSLDGHTLEDRL
jgi:hypothetical protein